MEPTAKDTSRIIPVAAGIELHPVTQGDAGEMYPLIEANRQRLREWLPWLDTNYSMHEMRQYLLEREWENHNGSSFTACIRASGQLCGAISLHTIDPRHRNSSIGYWLAAGFQGLGIMTQACRVVVTEAFDTYKLHRVEIRCATGNARSIAIPRRLGFSDEGLLREAEWLYDHWVDLHVFAMLEHEWHPLETLPKEPHTAGLVDPDQRA